MSDESKLAASSLIADNIKKHGHHVYVVMGESQLPRFSYTIGLSVELGFELVLAGAYFFVAEEVIRIVNSIAEVVKSGVPPTNVNEKIGALGCFSLRAVHKSWQRDLMLGVRDYFGEDAGEAFQIIPDSSHLTFDVPNLSVPWSAELEPAWQWLRRPWPYAVGADASAITNLAALRGERITEATRWEIGEWELFAGAGPDVPSSEIRIVPVGVLLAHDLSLSPILDLVVEEGLWRDADDGEWQPWRKKSQ